jgi:hypothetical protein
VQDGATHVAIPDIAAARHIPASSGGQPGGDAVDKLVPTIFIATISFFDDRSAEVK